MPEDKEYTYDEFPVGTRVYALSVEEGGGFSYGGYARVVSVKEGEKSWGK